MRRIAREARVGDRLPTETVLAREFGVSRETLREALAGLEKDGLIRRTPSRGTFIERIPAPGVKTRMTGLSEDFSRFKLDTLAEVLSTAEVDASADVERLLKPAGQRVHRFFRRRLIEGEPLALHEAFLPIEVGSRVAARDLTRTSIVQVLRGSLRLTIREEYQKIEALAADTEAAQLLGVCIGSPILFVERLFHREDGRPVALFRSQYRPDRYVFTVQLAQTVREEPEGPRAGVLNDGAARVRGWRAKSGALEVRARKKMRSRTRASSGP